MNSRVSYIPLDLDLNNFPSTEYTIIYNLDFWLKHER